MAIPLQAAVPVTPTTSMVTAAPAPKPKKQRQCSNCKGLGHFAKTCPKRTADEVGSSGSGIGVGLREVHVASGSPQSLTPAPVSAAALAPRSPPPCPPSTAPTGSEHTMPPAYPAKAPHSPSPLSQGAVKSLSSSQSCVSPLRSPPTVKKKRTILDFWGLPSPSAAAQPPSKRAKPDVVQSQTALRTNSTIDRGLGDSSQRGVDSEPRDCKPRIVQEIRSQGQYHDGAVWFWKKELLKEYAAATASG
eukprot:823508-Rhodomonas_salina.1